MRVRFWRTQEGHCLVEAFLDKLPSHDAQKVLWVLRLVERLERVPITYLKKLTGTNGVWEIRVQGTGQTYRLLAFHHRGTLWVTNGYSKKDRGTGRQQIARAEQARADSITAQRN